MEFLFNSTERQEVEENWVRSSKTMRVHGKSGKASAESHSQAHAPRPKTLFVLRVPKVGTTSIYRSGASPARRQRDNIYQCHRSAPYEEE